MTFRTFLCAGMTAAIAMTGSACATMKLNPNKAADSLDISRKIYCSREDGKAVTYGWEGRAFSRRQGEKDKLLFLVEGMNIRACTTLNDKEKGKGYALVSREILLYKDPKTGEVLSTWDNPWTGETVDVLHVANDPVNFKSYETGRDGKPAKWPGKIEGGLWYQSTTVPLYYPNPLSGGFQPEIGGMYHATEMFNFFGDTESLFDPATDETSNVHVSWERMSDWLPWMKMGNREGIIYMHTAGRKLESWNDLSKTMKAEIKKHYPEYNSAPPLDDDRKNMTSWKYYKGVKDGSIEAPNRK